MVDGRSDALETGLAYYRAWTAHDVDVALGYVADDIVCDSPSHGHSEGIEAFKQFLTHLANESLEYSILQVAFGDQDTALLWYEVHHVRGVAVPVAEWVTLRDNKIVQTRFLFDRLPFFSSVESFRAFLETRAGKVQPVITPVRQTSWGNQS